MDQALKEVILEAFALAIKSIEGQKARAKVEAVRKAFQAEEDKYVGAKQAFLTFATKTK